MAKRPERFIVTTRWRKLSKEEQIEEVRRAMANRHTNKSAARELGTTPGTVAGIRYKNNIASQHKPVHVPQAPEEVAETPSAPARFGVPVPKLKLTTDETEMCTYVDERKHRCAYLRVSGDPNGRCPLHQRKK